jgi:hypothetical protein
MTAPQTSDVDKPYRGRRLTWAEFHGLTGREPPKAANDNGCGQHQSVKDMSANNLPR